MGVENWTKTPPNNVIDGEDWSKLPKKVLKTITSKLEDSLVHHIRFGAICSSWRHVATKNRRRCGVSSKTPWLLFPITSVEKTWRDSYTRLNKKTRYGLLNLSQQKVYNLDLPDEIHSTHFFVAAYKSWILLSYEDGTSFLLNPFTSSKAMLPPKNNICVLSVSKFVLSESDWEKTSRDDFTVMAVHGTQHKLAFCKPGDESWTLIDDDNLTGIIDIMYHQGDFYALDELNGVTTVSSTSIRQIKTRVKSQLEPWQRISDYSEQSARNFLVGSSEKLLLIKRSSDNYQTIGFQVFELDSDRREWVRVRRLPGNSALFVGRNYSASVSLSESNSSLRHCRANCIYYVDHYKRFPVVFHDVAAFDLQDGGVQRGPYAQGVLDIDINFLQGDAVWITPSLS